MTSTPEERPRQHRFRHRFLIPTVVSGGLGLFNLFVGLNRPTIANMRTVDLLHLLATGALLGVTLAAVALYLVDRHHKG